MNTLFECDSYSGLRRSAELSECGRYRWWLRRSWSGGNGKTVCFVMLNPSTADALKDDPTIRRCVAFAQAWGYSVLSVRNLFAYRATDPKELLTAENPTGGPRGDAELAAAATAELLIAAWGADVPFGRDIEAVAMFYDKPLHCLKLSKHGKPWHPLYVRGDAVPLPFTLR
jgi:hypothetical protein